MRVCCLFMAVAAAAAVLPGVVAHAAADDPAGGKYWVFLGTSGRGSQGIYRFDFDAATGRASGLELATTARNPNFLAIHPSGKFVYAVGEIIKPEARVLPGVMAFAIDRDSGKLRRLNAEPSPGAGPCHVVVDRAGTSALIANYGGGSAASYPIGPDGKLGPVASTVQHRGHSADPKRQQSPHAHSINLDPANRFAVVADLGLDRVFVYRFDGDKSTLTANDPPAAAVSPGAGPRHFAFHPTRPFAYVINEMGNTVTVFDYDAGKGVLTRKQDVSTLPADYKGTSYTAEVVVHPSGKFLYGSNRGHDSIAVFAIDAATGELKPVEHQGKDIKTPRNIAIDPTGRWLLVGNQGSDSVVVFRIDPASGKLEPTGAKVEVPAPICIRFLKK